MSCTITTRDADGVVICDVSGRMSFPDPHINNHIDSAIKTGHRGFVINLSGVSYMDSYGLHDLVMAHNSVNGAKGKLVLLKPVQNVRKVIELTMKQVFAIHDDEAVAVQAVRT